MSGERVDVSVLIPARDEERDIREAVASMRAQQFGGTIEFLFMDGASRYRTREILSELAAEDPRIRVFDNPRATTPCGLNIGLRHARGTYVARMDAHAHYPPHYLQRAVERLDAGDVTQVFGPQIPEGSSPWGRRIALALSSSLGTAWSRRWAEGHAGEEVEAETGVFTGVWRRDVVEALGGWDEGWPINQDSELAARIRADGGRIVCLPELAAVYVPRDTLRALARQYFRYGMYRAKTALRHPETVRPQHLVAPAFAVTAVAALLTPRPVRSLARLGVAAYGGLVAFTAARSEAPRSDAAALPLALAIMHLAWGAGYLIGAVRFAGVRAGRGAPARGAAAAGAGAEGARRPGSP